MTGAADVLWQPLTSGELPRIERYRAWLAAERGLHLTGYASLWEWSVTDLAGFWASIWDYFDIEAAEPYRHVLSDRRLPGARWFEGATLNYAQHLVRGARTATGPVVASRSQTRPPVDLDAAALEDLAGRARAGLARLGVRRGDRVAAYLPSVPETLAAYLACASLGAVWSSCAPEFGTRSVVDRLRQIGPKVLLAADGYRFADRAVDRVAEVAEIRSALPSLDHVVAFPYLEPDRERLPGAISWADLVAEPAPLRFDPVPFDHPLHILFTSGTTGLPKPLVHGHGGVLLDQMKGHALHGDLGPGDRLFFFSTLGWMAWNWMVSALAVGAGVLLLDGNLLHPGLEAPWQLAEETGVTVYGASPVFLDACRQAGVVPRDVADLSAVRAVTSGGSPLSPALSRWVYDAVGKDVYLQSISGGTEVVGVFVGGSPTLPVQAGRITCPWLGCKVEAFDPAGHPVTGQEGELVVTEPMPSMPIGLWGDDDGSRYRATYFDEYPGVWHHGDRVAIYADRSCVISGRSDATLNRGGVRLGTGEVYNVVEALPEVADSLVIHLEDPGGGAGRLVLFVVLAAGAVLDDGLRTRVAAQLRASLSPRHVPDEVVAVPAVPRTLTGKKLEVPIKRILMGTPVEAALSRGALADPGALDTFLAAARSAEQHERSTG